MYITSSRAIIVSLIIVLLVVALAWARFDTNPPRTATVRQVTGGYTIACTEDHNPYPYQESVASDFEALKDVLTKCFTMKIGREWGK